jgi:hypothetical protein
MEPHRTHALCDCGGLAISVVAQILTQNPRFGYNCAVRLGFTAAVMGSVGCLPIRASCLYYHLRPMRYLADINRGKTPPIVYVPMREEHDCMTCVAAMLLGVSYEEVEAAFGGNIDP